ncbi:MAG: ATP-binding protein, partial [Pseudomonadota bacterium]
VARAAFAALASQGTPSLTGEMSSSFDYGGAKYVSTLVPMEGVPRWTIGVYAPEDDFIGAIKANRNQHIVIAIAVALATAVIGWLLAHVIHRPVAVLAARANHISRGRIDPPSPLPSSFAELDRAGRAFNRMSTSLTRYKEENDDLTAKLRHASRTLEIKVDERTAELAAVNDKLHDEIAVRALAEKQAEDEVARHRATTEKLEAAVQNATVANAAKSRFLSSMSHELRSPLNAIIGFSQMAIDRDATLEREARLSYLSHIRSSGDQLLALVNDVLDLESIESGHTLLSIQAVDPRTCIDAVIAEQAVPAADKRITLLDRTDEGGLPTLSTDTVRMRQILCNLLSNAVKYTDEGGEIRIDAARRGAFLRLTVSDNGPGIDKALHHRVFEPFDRLGAESSSIEGTGVGLALSRQLAESLGGRIGFDSELGRGSD